MSNKERYTLLIFLIVNFFMLDYYNKAWTDPLIAFLIIFILIGIEKNLNIFYKQGWRGLPFLICYTYVFSLFIENFSTLQAILFFVLNCYHIYLTEKYEELWLNYSTLKGLIIIVFIYYFFWSLTLPTICFWIKFILIFYMTLIFDEE